jgi:hypothetical protein
MKAFTALNLAANEHFLDKNFKSFQQFSIKK